MKLSVLRFWSAQYQALLPARSSLDCSKTMKKFIPLILCPILVVSSASMAAAGTRGCVAKKLSSIPIVKRAFGPTRNQLISQNQQLNVELNRGLQEDSICNETIDSISVGSVGNEMRIMVENLDKG